MNTPNLKNSSVTKEPYVELNTFLKIHQIAPTGGQIKVIIRSGAVKVNGTIDTRNKRKLVSKDIVEYDKKKFIVDLDALGT